MTSQDKARRESEGHSESEARRVLELVETTRLVAILRLDDLSTAVELSQALLAAGVLVQEFTLTNPQALEAVVRVKEQLAEFRDGRAVVGVGSVRSESDVVQAQAAGAQFVVTPILLPSVIERAFGRDRQDQLPVMCGAYTPTEIATAAAAGADVVKVFPARSLGPNYIRDVLAPMPELKLMPTGGVNLENLQAYLQAGAYAVGIGSNLFDLADLERGAWASITERARQYAQAARVCV